MIRATGLESGTAATSVCSTSQSLTTAQEGCAHHCPRTSCQHAWRDAPAAWLQRLLESLAHRLHNGNTGTYKRKRACGAERRCIYQSERDKSMPTPDDKLRLNFTHHHFTSPALVRSPPVRHFDQSTGSDGFVFAAATWQPDASVMARQRLAHRSASWSTSTARSRAPQEAQWLLSGPLGRW